ncbi:MAG TPA: zinc ribbon domain-containing protein [Thermodesulfovibrionales bacterium]|jgi:putative FmdB family regulatory protein|nr:zinc ribbon domain-containing protein [Thermodesulfovibrionales bacterium]
MPIYEFRCLGCGHVFEFLKLKKEAEEMKCPKCNSEEVERVLSVVSVSKSLSGKASSTVKSCGGGTCATIDVPGPKR